MSSSRAALPATISMDAIASQVRAVMPQWLAGLPSPLFYTVVVFGAFFGMIAINVAQQLVSNTDRESSSELTRRSSYRRIKPSRLWSFTTFLGSDRQPTTVRIHTSFGTNAAPRSAFA